MDVLKRPGEKREMVKFVVTDHCGTAQSSHTKWERAVDNASKLCKKKADTSAHGEFHVFVRDNGKTYMLSTASYELCSKPKTGCVKTEFYEVSDPYRYAEQ